MSLVAARPSPSPDKLGDGDTITLDRTGRNPEVEEVLGALSLVLNGGGVAQLKTIASELNNALEGREGDGASRCSTGSTTFMRPARRRARTRSSPRIERVNALSVSLNKQTDDPRPGARGAAAARSKSVDRQRDDLVKMLRALADLSAVGTRVIQASKAGDDRQPQRARARR